MKKLMTLALLLVVVSMAKAAGNNTGAKTAGFQMQHFPQTAQKIQTTFRVAASMPLYTSNSSIMASQYYLTPNPGALPPAAKRSHWGGAVLGAVMGALVGVVIAEIAVKPDDGYLDFTGLSKAIIIGGCGIAGGITLGIIGLPIKEKQ
jgi:hypothetical protein